MKRSVLSLLGWLTGVLVAATAQDIATAKQSASPPAARVHQRRPLKDVLVDLEKRHGVHFLYEGHLLDKRRVRYEASQTDKLDAVLQRILDADLRYRQVENTLYAIFPAGEAKTPAPADRPAQAQPESRLEAAPDRQLTGKVTDGEKGQGLPGVSIVLKGTTTGTTTDGSGQYRLTVPEAGAVLVFSYVGYVSQEVNVGTRTAVDVTLQAETRTLGEVVVIGYGTQRKRDVTGSIGSVSAAEIKALPVTNASQALQGRVAGVQVSATDAAPGGAIRVRIRGGNSINANSGPLYVIDGFAGVGDLNSINPNDIESLEVLKDASATAIYGARGANGVVLITTKRGKSGQSNVDFESYYGFQQVGKQLDMLNAREQATLINEAIANDNQYAAANNQKPLFFTPDQIQSFGEGTDWQREIFRVAPMQNYQLTLSGGEAKTRYAISGNYFNQQGIIHNSGFKRGSLRINLDRDISAKLSLNNSLVISRSLQNAVSANTDGSINAPSVTQSALTISPIQSVYNATGGYNRNYTGLFPVENPYALAVEPVNKLHQNRVIENLALNYNPTDWLTVKISGGIDFANTRGQTYFPSTLLLSQSNNGIARLNQLEHFSWINENTVTFSRTFAQKHALNVLAGFTQQSTRDEGFGAESRSFATDALTFNSLETGSDFRRPNSTSVVYTLLSYIGRINYVLSDKYLFTFTARADGSSRFAKNNKWGYFPSGAVAWRLSEEPFLKSVDFVNDLKLRASYGITGNQEIGSYNSIAALGTFPYVFGTTVVTGFHPTRVANPDLRWEQSAQLDLGLDLSMFNDRLSVTADYYNRRTSDLLLSKPLPQITGYSSLVQNIGSIENKGVELAITSRNLAGQGANGLKWTTSLNLTVNRNKVLDLGVNEFGKENIIYTGGGSSHLAVPNVGIAQVGQPLGSFFGLVTDGIFQNLEEVKAGFQPNAKPGDQRYKDLNGDKKIDNNDRAILGNAQPNFFYGLTNTLSFKGFDLNIFLQGVQGAKLFNLNRVELESLNGIINNTANVLDRWTPTNPGATLPRATASVANQASDRYVEDASYLRLRNVSLGYNVPSDLARKVRLRSARLYVSGQNLFTLTKYLGYDPETNSRGADSNTNLGVDYGSYPYTKTVTIGLNLGL